MIAVGPDSKQKIKDAMYFVTTKIEIAKQQVNSLLNESARMQEETKQQTLINEEIKFDDIKDAKKQQKLIRKL